MTFEMTATQLFLLMLPFLLLIVGIKKRVGGVVMIAGLFLVFLALLLGFPFAFMSILVFLGFIMVFSGVFV